MASVWQEYGGTAILGDWETKPGDRAEESGHKAQLDSQVLNISTVCDELEISWE